MQQPQRLSLRFEICTPGVVNLDAVIPVFHQWIQARKSETMLIDVADYKHVPEGPGVIMLGHTDDFGIDNGVSQGSNVQGFYYVRKHARLTDTQPLDVRLQELWERALRTAARLEQEADLQVVIDPTRIQLALLDRLVYPCTLEALAAVRDDVARFFADVLDGRTMSLSHCEPDMRYPMTWYITVDGDCTVSELLATAGQVPTV